MYGADDSPVTVLRSWLFRRPISTVFLFFLLTLMIGAFVLQIFDKPIGVVFPKKSQSLLYLDEFWQGVTVMTTSKPV